LMARLTSHPPAGRILIVGGEPHEAEFLGFVLTDVGYQVAVAGDGEQALALAERFAPDAMVVDLVLPHLSGWEFLEQLRSDPKSAEPIILALGQGDVPQTKARAVAAGADAYCTKPVPPSSLLGELSKLGVPPPVS